MRLLKNIILLIMLFVLTLFILINLRLSNIIENSFTQFTSEYTNNVVICLIFRTAIILDFIMILSIIFYYVFDLSNNLSFKFIIRRTLIILNIILLILIWFEIFFGSTFQHGYERTLLALNNCGLLGSLFFSLSIFVFLKYENINFRKKILMSLLAFVVILIHFAIYNR